MKVIGEHHPTGAAAKTGQPFKKLLDETNEQLRSPSARQAPAPTGAVAVTTKPTTAVAVSSQTKAAPAVAAAELARARAKVTAEAQRLTQVRKQTTVAEKTTAQADTMDHDFHQKVIDRVLAELTMGDAITSSHSMTPPPVGAVLPPEQRAASMSHSLDVEHVRSQQAAALIEKIELFVHSARPAMRLALNNSLGATVEIERLGPRRIALKLVGRNGELPSASAVSQIREEMRARGLEVAALSIS